MSFVRKHLRLILVAVSCVVIGAGASAIATSGASTSTTTTTTAARNALRGALRKGLRPLELRRLAIEAVQGTLVVRTKKGFVDVTFNRGKVDSVNGQQLTITVGTKKASYKTVTLTIPADARVRDNRQKAVLSDLTMGQRVSVIQAPQRTWVIAVTPKAA
jgi:hypothetical protein